MDHDHLVEARQGKSRPDPESMGHRQVPVLHDQTARCNNLCSTDYGNF